MKLPSIFKNTSPAPQSKSSSSSWPWPSCTQTRTLSFRIPASNEIFKTMNSAYFDTNTTPDSYFTNSSADCPSFSTTVSDDSAGMVDPIETVITKGLRSERLFFEPGETSSILDKDEASKSIPEEGEESGVDELELGDEDEDVPFMESVALSIDSPDPYADFRKSMEEMVEAHGLKDWEHLEELLCWYLKVNGKSNHGYIVGAFVDLLVSLAFTSSTSSSTNYSDPAASCSETEYNSPSTPLSFYNTSCSSSSSTSTPCFSCVAPDELEPSTETISTSCTTTNLGLSSLLEAAEEEINEEDDVDGDEASWII